MSNPAQQNITLVKKLYDEVYTKNNLASLDQLFTADVRLNDPAVPNFKGGLPALKEKETQYHTAFPNKTSRIEDIFGDGNEVTVRWTTQGTHKGELQGIPPSGKNIKFSGISIYKITNGKISEISQSWDRLGLLEQIGAIHTNSPALHR